MPWPAHIQRLINRAPALGLIGDTPLVRLDVLEREIPGATVLAKVESRNPGGSLKDRPVLRMLGEALHTGALSPEQTILDSSSGNAGIAYAMIGSILGLEVEIVIPDNASAERKKRIAAHGATMVLTDAVQGYDEALREVRRRHQADPARYFFADQYGNESNWRAHYETTAEEILAQAPARVSHFVAGVGTGGTITGVGRRLKEYDASVRVICVIPDEFPGIEGLKPLGSADDIVPEILDESVIDERVHVSIDDAYDMCQRLAKRGLFCGQSSGAYLAGVRAVAMRGGGGTFVTMLNDLGERYFSTRLWDG